MKTTLDKLIRHFHMGWMIDNFVPKDEALPALEKALEAANKISDDRFGVGEFPITADELAEELENNPHRVNAFLQALAATLNPEMLVMAWRAISGARIVKVDLHFEYRTSCTLTIVLEGASGDQDAPYTSHEIEDAALIRHFSIARVNGKPVYDGFYPIHYGA